MPATTAPAHAAARAGAEPRGRRPVLDAALSAGLGLRAARAARGGGAWDHSAMVRALELLGDHEIGGGAKAA